MIIWLVGLSGAGKTTIGREIYAQWKADAPNTVLVDGDEIREVFRHNRGDYAYTLDGRRTNAERLSALCAWLEGQDINVVCCCLSVFEQTRRWNRENFSDYFEVYVRAPIAVLAERDIKNLYRPALAGERINVVGVDLPFEEPASPDMIVDNDSPGMDARAVANQILRAARTKQRSG